MAEETIKAIRSILNVTPAGMLIQEINAEYKSIMGESIPFAKFNCTSLQEFLRSSGQFNAVKTLNGFKLTAKVVESSKHVTTLARTQNVSKQERKRRKNMAIAPPATLRRSQSKNRLMSNASPMPKKYGAAQNPVSIRSRRNSFSRNAPSTVIQNIATPKSTHAIASQPSKVIQNIVPPQPTQAFASQPSKVIQNIAPSKTTNAISCQPMPTIPPACTQNQSNNVENPSIEKPPALVPAMPTVCNRLKNFTARLLKFNQEHKTPERIDLHARLSPKCVEAECVVQPKPLATSVTPSYTPLCTPLCTPMKQYQAKSNGYHENGHSPSSKTRVNLHARLTPKQLPLVEDHEEEVKIPSGRALFLKKAAKLAEMQKGAKETQNGDIIVSKKAEQDENGIKPHPKRVKATNLDEISQKLNNIEVNSIEVDCASLEPKPVTPMAKLDSYVQLEQRKNHDDEAEHWKRSIQSSPTGSIHITVICRNK